MGAETVRIVVDGVAATVPKGVSLAAALLSGRHSRFRTSVTGDARGPVCGMGTCFECVVTVNGRAWVCSCLVECVEGLEVSTDGPPH
jgi:D-hydroxyproline dehydrogenase subunit gamma